MRAADSVVPSSDGNAVNKKEKLNLQVINLYKPCLISRFFCLIVCLKSYIRLGGVYYYMTAWLGLSIYCSTTGVTNTVVCVMSVG